MKDLKVIMVGVMVLLSIPLMLDGKNRCGNDGSKVKEVTLKTPDIESGDFKIDLMIKKTLFASPVAGTVDEQGNIYVVDRKLTKLFRFSKEGELLKSIGQKGAGPGDFSMPMIVKYRNNKLYVFEYQLSFANIFDKELNFIEQKKFPDLRNPFDVEFRGDDIVISSSVMQMFMGHQLFLFSLNGEMKGKFVPDEENDPEKTFKGRTMKMKYPSLLCIDPLSGNLWNAAVTPYVINGFNEDFEKIKSLKGDKIFKFKDQEAGRGQLTFKAPVDLGFFFTIREGKIFYGYRYNDEAYLDIIENESIIKRFKSKEIRKIFSMIGKNSFLVNFNEGEGDEDPTVGIVSIK